MCATLCVSLSVAGSSCAAYSFSFTVPVLDPNRISEPSAVSCLPRCLAFQLASHQKLDACLFYWHVNLCDATYPASSLYLLYHPLYCYFCRFFISAFIVYRIVFHVYFINNFSNTANTDTPIENEIYRGVEESNGLVRARDIQT